MTIALENVGNVAFTTIEYDAEDDGSVDLATTATDPVTLRFSAPGLHNVRVRVKDAQGSVIFTEKRYAFVDDPVARAKAMQRIFTDMIERLKIGDIDHAVTAISNTTREQYRALFTSMGSGLAAMAAAIGTVTNATVGDEYAWLKVIRNESDGTHGYTIYLIEDGDGIRRIETM
ncbi:MAG: hypothetical protein ACM3SO_24480 [Betaproteobacteria bacterium]